MILHHGTTFVVARPGGDIEPEAELGLYFEDVRFLSRHELRVDGKRPVVLTTRTPDASSAIHFLTNPTLDGAPRGTLGIVRRQSLGASLHETIEIDNYGDETARFTLSFVSDADFLHIFQIKVAVEQSAPDEGDHVRPKRQRRILDDRIDRLRVEIDGRAREVVRRLESPASFAGDEARVRIELPPRGHRVVSLQVMFGSDEDPAMPRASARPTPEPPPRLDSDRETLVRAYRQSTQDMAALRLALDNDRGEERITIAAGIPWFMALFGRDSLIASYQTILHDPSLARGTLQLLADLQGKKIDPISGEAPGKILHEHRHQVAGGAHRLIPKFPYYGSIDATPLFLITLSEHARATGDLAFTRALYPNVLRAVEWMEKYGDRDGDLFLEYWNETDQGLKNQGWKDSGDSIRFRDGRTGEGPIALVEVQGYAIDALRRAAEIASRFGERDDERRLRDRAEAMADKLDAAFWLEERGSYALALDGTKRKVDALTSNPGHLLWSGVVPRARAARLADTLLSEAMFSGYGVRTMATSEGAFNPISYHDGSVWPHDSSIIAFGLARAGFPEHAAKICAGLFDAIDHYDDDRLPELFAGYPAARYGTPVEYPSANRPQAWASGAVMLLVRAMLGLDVDALAKEIRLRPFLIEGCDRLELRDVPIGVGRVDVRFTRRGAAIDAELSRLPADWRRIE